MAVAGEVSVGQDGRPSNAKLHPYLVTLVRWCVSCIWSTATVLLHRLITAPLPSISAKPSPRASAKPRPASTDHLHPEPRVECVVLHQPPTPTLDVIFVHGLYGSLGNTWRQGEWGAKYKTGPNKVPLRNHENKTTDKNTTCNFEYETDNEKNMFDKHRELNEKCGYDYEENFNEDFTVNQINSFQNVLPEQDELITEKFYNNTLLDQIEVIDNYESQAKFVQDLFKNDFKQSEMRNRSEVNACKCSVTCDVGCGCVCDQCYSDCWPKDWIQRDFPGARVISINYTSDPYLWRPLWVKESKRLRLHERADQMMEQLLALGVGSRPIIWVGHSKGGLFIKQLYCDAYEAYNSLHKDKELTQKNEKTNSMEQIGSYEEKSLQIYAEENRVQSQPSKVDEGMTNKAGLWLHSAGFMFYSVPHRGSPLADFKTPITARSIELLEICKDCALVVSLQEKWLQAVWERRPPVASLVETGKTLMSVLWLRIVSVDSADAGIGTLSGVSVDHREICKPSSRTCQLYTELTELIKTALAKCNALP